MFFIQSDQIFRMGNSREWFVNIYPDGDSDIVLTFCPFCHNHAILLKFFADRVCNCHLDPIDPEIQSICPACVEHLNQGYILNMDKIVEEPF